MKLKSHKLPVYKADKKHRISAKDANPARDRVITEEEANSAMLDKLLLETPALPSALQVSSHLTCTLFTRLIWYMLYTLLAVPGIC